MNSFHKLISIGLFSLFCSFAFSYPPCPSTPGYTCQIWNGGSTTGICTSGNETMTCIKNTNDQTVPLHCSYQVRCGTNSNHYFGADVKGDQNSAGSSCRSICPTFTFQAMTSTSHTCQKKESTFVVKGVRCGKGYLKGGKPGFYREMGNKQWNKDG